MASVDVVVVSYNSRQHLRECVAGLAHDDDLHVIVVDNASSDDSLETVADLRVETSQLAQNRGFSAGCNAGARLGSAPYVLLLNPDARIDPEGIHVLLRRLASDSRVGLVAPKTTDLSGTLLYSRRRFPRLVSTYSRALFLHRLFPHAAAFDECLRDGTGYERRGEVEWVSGSCMLIRRSLLDELNGLDEGFFMYYEDTDLCRRVWDAGFTVEYDPSAVCAHVGGASAPRAALLPAMARSAARYASKHAPRRALMFRLGLALEAAVRVVVSKPGTARGRGHARAVSMLLRGA